MSLGHASLSRVALIEVVRLVAGRCRVWGVMQVGNRKGAHHRGAHQLRARAIVAQANANPATRCGRCGRTLAEHEPHRNGTPARWDAGHVHDGQVNGPLRPEASTCNRSAGATAGNQRRRGLRTTREW